MKQMLDSFLSKDVWNSEDQASLIAFIAGLSPKCVSHDGIENLSKVLAKILSVIDQSERENIFFQSLSKGHVIITGCKVIVSRPWFFIVLLINSLRHYHLMFSTKNRTLECNDFIYKVIVGCLRNIRILEQNSIYLLRTLSLILNKRSDILTPELGLEIIKCMHWAALSPLAGFKQYTHSITKICLKFLTSEQKAVFCDYSMIPVRGIETYNLLNLFSFEYLDKHIDEIINTILHSFKTNMENKDGSILYESILAFKFGEWKLKVWPLLSSNLRNIDQEGEFFQSLLKYWIPLSVNAYKQDFYSFVRDQQVDMVLKGYILLETRKKGFANIDVTEDIWKLFHNLETVNLAIRIISTYHKKSICPSNYEIKLILEFLRSNIQLELNDEDIKSLTMFFSQLFLSAHTNLLTPEETFESYRKIVDVLYYFCYHSLRTDLFEVGVQVSQTLLNILTGSHKKLFLIYKLEKKDYYEEGKNALFLKLMSKKCLKFGSLEFQIKLKHCLLMKGGNSKYSANLILSHYPHVCWFDITSFREILSGCAKTTCLKSIEKIMNLSRVLLNSRNTDNVVFINEIMDVLLENMNDFRKCSTYRNILLLTVVSIATQNNFKISNLVTLLEKCFEYILFLIHQNVASNMTDHSPKVYETFINTVIKITIQNLDIIWSDLNKMFITDVLMNIIEQSNMKKPVTVSADALMHIFVKMEEYNNDSVDKILLTENVLRCIYGVPKRANLKIRRHPEYRLVLHALCLADQNPNKPFLHWIIQALIQIIKNDGSPDISVSRSLHCIEILISENTFHTHTLSYVEEIIILCVELFRNDSWIIRNADLQLAKALIDRFFGVSLNYCNRPKTIEHLFVLFPNLLTYFFKILSLESLDGRATMAFQFFLESQIKENIWEHITGECLPYFRVLFNDIIRNYANHFGRLAIKSLVALTKASDISNIISNVCWYIKINFMNMRGNIIYNLISLVKELYEKYKKAGMKILAIEVCLHDLSEFLRKHNSSFFDFILVKIDGPSNVMDKLQYYNDDAYEKRIWLNNYVPLLVNSKCFLHYLNDILSARLPNCQKVKVLSILLSKFERGCLNNVDVSDLLEIMIENCLLENDGYLLVCYYRFISLILLNIQANVNIGSLCLSSHLNNLYKAQVSVLYQSVSKAGILSIQQSASILNLYLNHIGLTEDIDSDIAYSLTYFPEDIPVDSKYLLYKIVLYYLLRQSTYLDAYNFITIKTKKQYHSILTALECLISQSLATENLGEYTHRFYCDMERYIREMHQNSGKYDGFYEIESDLVVPMNILASLLVIRDSNS